MKIGMGFANFRSKQNQRLQFLAEIEVAAGIGLGDVVQEEPVIERSRSEEHTSELQSPCNLVCRLLLEKKNKRQHDHAVHSHRISRINVSRVSVVGRPSCYRCRPRRAGIHPPTSPQLKRLLPTLL